MTRPNNTTWRLDRRINLSVVVQLMVLASLIVGSWANLQRQLDLLQRDVTMLLESQKDFQRRLNTLHDKTISHEYRLQRIEKATDENQCAISHRLNVTRSDNCTCRAGIESPGDAIPRAFRDTD
jgi:hypothetical protein